MLSCRPKEGARDEPNRCTPPHTSRPGFIGERAWPSAVKLSPSRLKGARTAVIGCGESGA